MNKKTQGYLDAVKERSEEQQSLRALMPKLIRQTGQQIYVDSPIKQKTHTDKCKVCGVTEESGEGKPARNVVWNKNGTKDMYCNDCSKDIVRAGGFKGNPVDNSNQRAAGGGAVILLMALVVLVSYVMGYWSFGFCVPVGSGLQMCI